MAPDAPTGCPRAIAPPFGLVIAGSKFNSLATAQAWAANASFDSIQSICEIFSPASDSASCTAGIGPSPIKFGATPFSPYDIILAMTGIEYFETECSLASTKAAAPSFIPDELPAVTVPSLSKAGFSLVKSSKLTAFL